MGNAGAENQNANIVPPRTNGTFAFTLDNTSRRKDLGALDLAGVPVAKGGSVFITVYANVKWWFRMSATDSGSVDETAIDAAVAAVTFQAGACIEVQAYQPVDIRIDRTTDRYLMVKGAGAGTMRG